MGFLPQAMVNYLALLGWGDGTENEFFTLDQLGQSIIFCQDVLLVIPSCLWVFVHQCVQPITASYLLTLFAVDKFTIERVNKSGAVFDSTKLR